MRERSRRIAATLTVASDETGTTVTLVVRGYVAFKRPDALLDRVRGYFRRVSDQSQIE